MKIYLHKSLGYRLISLALILAFGPFDGNPFEKKYDPVQIERFCQQFSPTRLQDDIACLAKEW